MRVSRLNAAGLALLALAAFGACGKERLVQLSAMSLVRNNTGTVTVNFCTDPPTPLPFENDYIMLVDTSENNTLNCQQTDFVCNTPLVTEPGTNPNGNLSFGVIDAFLANILQVDPNDQSNYFALIEYNNSPSVIQPLTNDLPGFRGVVDGEWAKKNFYGFTDLTDTLIDLNQTVQNIVNTESGKLVPTLHRIVVVLIGDGIPEVLGANQTVSVQTTPGLVAQVTQLENLVQQNPQYIQSLTIYTVYEYVSQGGYTSFTPQGEQLFQELAAAGNGVEFDSGNGQIPPYEGFVLPTISNPYKLTDLFVRDMNTEWTNASLDTSSDGMFSDSFRMKNGAPVPVVLSGNSDSDGNGVSDLVEYTLTGTSICHDPLCAHDNATQYQNGICGSYIESVTPTQVTYTRNILPQDIFNDCEKTLLHASTNSELIRGLDIPQDLAAIMFYPLAAAGSTSWLNSSAFNDGYTPYQRIKYNVAPSANVNSIVGLKTYQYQLTYLGPSPGPKDCYQATVDNVSLSMLSSDAMEVYVVETGVQSSTSKVRIGRKQTDQNGNVTFSDGDLL